MPMNCEIPASERLYIFEDAYMNDRPYEPGWSLVYLVRAAGQYLGQIVGEERAAAGMAEMLIDLVDVRSDPKNWAEDVVDAGIDAYSNWPLGLKLYELTAYGFYGIAFRDTAYPLYGISHPDSEKAMNEMPTEDYLRGLVETGVKFSQSTPFEIWAETSRIPDDFLQAVTLGKNRWALDHGDPVEPAALALFGNLQEVTVRNMMSGGSAKFTNIDGKIPAREALDWLASRPSFYDSIWRDNPEPRIHDKVLEIPVFVPVARDGSIFHPGLERNGGFTIGRKGEEQKISDFDAALKELQIADPICWRRPNDQGNWGIVKANRWERFDRAFIESLAAQPRYRLPENKAPE